jgi:RHS repeat-associated protein
VRDDDDQKRQRPAANEDAPSLSAPALSLPKSGGALRGMGEKFSANPTTGGASLTIPIYTSPGRGGLGPDLSLSYSPSAPNGPFGLGFSLALPSVVRRTEKLLPKYGDEDVFILAGVEDLVRSGFHGIWTEGERVDGNWVVSCYQPRVDGLFARIERWTDWTSGDFHWRSITRDNRIQVFGRSPETRLADPDDPRRVYRWLLESTSDSHGNQICYRYRAEDGLNVAPAIYQRNRRCTNVYLDRVLYGNRPKGEARPDHPEDWLFEVVLDYGERIGQKWPSYTPPAAWTERRDPFSSFKPGFEVRTQRLCRRVLMFHRIDDPATPVLVRSTELSYDERPDVTFLVSAHEAGYDVAASATEQLPPVTLGYTQGAPDGVQRVIDPDSLENAPVGLDGKRFRWLDLDGEGLAGVLYQEPNAWHYKRNEGGGRLGSATPVRAFPTAAAGGGAPQLVDLERDGHKYLVDWSGSTPGAQARLSDGSWGPFLPLRGRVLQEVGDANARLIDLDGDGRPDLLSTEDTALRWYPSLGKDGFGAPLQRVRSSDEDQGPAVSFAIAEETIHLADMSGDGLTDIVRIRNGEVCYWPNLGYGRFGAKITMAGAPHFDRPERFDPKRLRLTDVDGTGTTDLIYLDDEGARCFLNCAGNSFAAAQPLIGFPGYDCTSHADALDLLGNGTSCLVWSSPLPNNSGRAMRYLELTGGIKPHLLAGIDNGRGARTALSWAASTEFYLADRRAGTPWATRLPFPVQVVKQVDTSDAVTGDALTTRYVYHHGYYDGVEWEFRGFGMVETWDAENVDRTDGGDPLLRLPACHTKTWFHTGAFLEGATLSQRFATEYFTAPGIFAPTLPESTLENVSSSLDAREATRALAGKVLRSEVYADDDATDAAGNPLTGIPFSVTANNYHVKALRPASESRHGIFLVRARESVTFQLERNPADPRVTHQVTIDADDFGNVTNEVSLAYPRRPQNLEGVDGQERLYATHVHRDLVSTPDQNDWHRAGVLVETRRWEVTGLVGPAPTVAAPTLPFAVVAQIPQAPAIAFEAQPSPNQLQRRLIGDAQVFYRADDGQTELALGQVEPRGLVGRTRRMAFSAALIGDVFDANHPLPPNLLDDNGYSLDNGQHWAEGGACLYDPARFSQPTVFTDPFGNATALEYDANALFAVASRDALGNTSRATVDSRVLAPIAILDPNGNQKLAAYDPLGRLRATALQGKAPPANQPPAEGDTLDSPTTLVEHHLESLPNYVISRVRETHQYPGAAAPDYRYTFTYYDGFGRVVLSKIEDDDGQPATQMSTRWVGSGRAVHDNKGNVVKKYEPYFSASSDYEPEEAMAQIGVSDVMRYDPLDRVIRVDHPNGTFRLVSFDAWTKRSYDENDTLGGHGPNAWYQKYGVPSPQTPQEVAAVNAYEHRDTPAIAKLDPLGRTVATVAVNVEYPGGVRTPVEYPGTSSLDIQGNPLTITAGNQRPDGTAVSLVISRQRFDMLGRPLFRDNSDTGKSWSLIDPTGQQLFAEDARGPTPSARGYRLTWSRDALRRVLARQMFAPGASGAVVAEAYVYGEGLSNLTDENGAPATPQSLNLLGRAYQQKDGAGVVTNIRYDLHGTLVAQSRQLLADYTTPLVDWSASNTLDPAEYLSVTRFDAMSRPVSLEEPDGDRANQVRGSLIEQRYGKRALLASVTMTPRGATTAQAVVTGIDYDARGQRQEIRYGNGAVTRYTYEPDTFRLSTVTSTDGQGQTVQAFTYTYDPVANVAQIDDAATPTITYNGGAVSSSQTFVYDALYRLVRATGREHIAQTTPQDQVFGYNLPAATQANAFRSYTESYAYDRLGNFRSMQHLASVGGGAINNWTRLYETDVASGNRLLSTSQSGSEPGPHYALAYSYDAAGNVTRMPHLGGAAGQPNCAWNEKNQLSSVILDAASDPADASDRAYYTYDAAGQRARKVVLAAGSVKRERIYLGSYEITRHFGSGGLTERHSLHVTAGTRRVALFETKTSDNGTRVAAAAPVARYQLDNHLGSSMIELADSGKQLSREEYHPFGTTSYYAEPSALLGVDVKRYRHSGKERDDETGFCYYGARYSAPWLGRWLSADPAGFVDGPNLYAFTRNNPIRLVDADGRQSDEEQTPAQKAAEAKAAEERSIKEEANRALSDEIQALWAQGKNQEGLDLIYNDKLRAEHLAAITDRVRAQHAKAAEEAAKAAEAERQKEAQRVAEEARAQQKSIEENKARIQLEFKQQEANRVTRADNLKEGYASQNKWHLALVVGPFVDAAFPRAGLQDPQHFGSAATASFGPNSALIDPNFGDSAGRITILDSPALSAQFTVNHVTLYVPPGGADTPGSFQGGLGGNLISWAYYNPTGKQYPNLEGEDDPKIRFSLGGAALIQGDLLPSWAAFNRASWKVGFSLGPSVEYRINDVFSIYGTSQLQWFKNLGDSGGGSNYTQSILGVKTQFF